MTRYTAVLDACVLHPTTVRGALLCLAVQGLFRPIWSERILDEWAASLVKKGIEPAKIAPHRMQFVANFEAAMTDTGVVDLSSLHLPDPNDVHVVETGVLGRADAIITFNLKDFPANELKKVGLEPIHPDLFLVNLIDLDEVRAVEALRQQRTQMTVSLPSVEDFLLGFERSKLIQTRARLEGFRGLL